MRPFYFLIGLAFFTIAVSCNVSKLVNPTVRQRYEKNFKGPDSLLIQWKNAYTLAQQNPLQVTLPFSFSARLPGQQALSYSFTMPEGQQLIVELQNPDDSAQLFVELFTYNSNADEKALKTVDINKEQLTYAIDVTDSFKLLLQPAIFNNEPFVVRIYPQPVFSFPVAGKGNAAMTSFWGAARDGGSRSHEGIDIFAARGTPLLAVADGKVYSTGDRGLGGKQVWLRDDILGRSVYYAHLDSIISKPGDRVKKGDTIGLVGNTGNAVTTSPHLHFGIYENGATDPLNYIKQLPVPPFAKTIESVSKQTRNTKNEVRAGPGNSYRVLQTLARNDTVLVIGRSEKWYHVQTGQSVQGFIAESSLK